MASSRGSVHSDTAKKEQIITEFFTKSLQIILESRSPYMSSRNYSGEQVVSSPSSSSSSSSSFRTRDKWFNLALRECPAALENIDFWRQSNLEPMVVDVILVQRSLDWDPMNFSPKGDFVKDPSLKEQVPNFMNLEHEEFGVESRNEKVIERWVVQYESRKGRDSGPGSKKSSGNLHTLYKKSIVLLRSLYVTIRLLPAYKLFRDLISSGQIRTFTLAHRVSSFVEPFTRREEADMQRFNFTSVDTSCGRLCLSVSYRPSVSDVSSEPSTPMSPQFIPDYVGSPLADPLKRFPSFPMSHGSPSCSPFSRRHSWSYENYRASSPSVLPSPSPTYSDSHASISKRGSCLPPPMSLPHHLPETGGKNTGFDEYWPSPAFSPSPSPSPPMYLARIDASKTLLRCESAPVSIPASKALNKQTLPPSPPPKFTRAATLKSDKSTGASGSSVEKFSLGRDESGRFSGVRISSSSSPRISFSRSSSRLSIQDDFDDSEFSCPFVVDDDDIMGPGSRPESYDQKGQPSDPLEPGGGSFPVRKSQDAAVGALVLMLKKAPPLRQDSLLASKAASCSNNNKEVVQKPEEGDPQSQKKGACSSSILSSKHSMSKTTADALEELRGYKQMKDALLGTSATPQEGFRENPSKF